MRHFSGSFGSAGLCSDCKDTGESMYIQMSMPGEGVSNARFLDHQDFSLAWIIVQSVLDRKIM